VVWFRSEKRQLEANRDGIGSLGKVSQGERLPLVEGGVSSKEKYPSLYATFCFELSTSYADNG